MAWSVNAATWYFVLRALGYGIGIGCLIAAIARQVAPFDPLGDAQGALLGALLPWLAAAQQEAREASGLAAVTSLRLPRPLLSLMLSAAVIGTLIAPPLIHRGRRRRSLTAVTAAGRLLTVSVAVLVAIPLYFLGAVLP